MLDINYIYKVKRALLNSECCFAEAQNGMYKRNGMYLYTIDHMKRCFNGMYLYTKEFRVRCSAEAQNGMYLYTKNSHMKNGMYLYTKEYKVNRNGMYLYTIEYNIVYKRALLNSECCFAEAQNGMYLYTKESVNGMYLYTKEYKVVYVKDRKKEYKIVYIKDRKKEMACTKDLNFAKNGMYIKDRKVMNGMYLYTKEMVCTEKKRNGIYKVVYVKDREK
ncbi:hypothetical protein ACJX0J_006909, partial [Zea mays]